MKKYVTVAEFMGDLSATKQKQVTILRKIILSSAPLVERIKWNAPSYVFDEEDRITFNTRGDDIKVVIHFGANVPEDINSEPVVQDVTGLVQWKSNIRGVISFKDIDDVMIKKNDFEYVIKQWLSIEG